MTYNSASRDIGVASASFYNLPAGVEGEEEEDDEHEAENGEDYHAHDQIHCTEGSAHVVWVVRDGVCLVEQETHCPPNCDIVQLRGENITKREGGREDEGMVG